MSATSQPLCVRRRGSRQGAQAACGLKLRRQPSVSTGVHLTLPSGRYYGETVCDIACDGLRLVESTIGPATALQSHNHENAYLCLVLAGSFEERSGSSTRSCLPSLLKYHPAGEDHSERFGRAGARLFRIELGGKWGCWANRLPARGESAAAAFRAGLPLMQRIHREVRGPACSLRVECLTLELLASLLRGQLAGSASPSCVSRARDFLDSCVDRRPSLEEIARVAGVHPVHLATRFRQTVGCTLGDYNRRVRIDRAQRQLLESESPIAEIALLCGFSDQSHFTRTFRAETGMPPAAFRRRSA
jgi:AraC family transcriptional regulator